MLHNSIVFFTIAASPIVGVVVGDLGILGYDRSNPIRGALEPWMYGSGKKHVGCV